jgi:glucose-6-phosphate isomerase
MPPSDGPGGAEPYRVDQSAAWQALRDHRAALGGTTLRQLFAADPGRGRAMTATAGDLYLDYSKHIADEETIRLLVALAEQAGLRERIDAMFRGEHINTTEDRAVLHVALRMPRDVTLVVDGQDVVADVHAVLDRMGAFADRVRSGAWRGHTGQRVRSVVNIGIGGSDLGPAMAYQALRAYSDRDLTFRFVSNVDPTDMVEAVRDLDPATTLFIVCSKTFTTQETLANSTASVWTRRRTRAPWPSTSSRSRRTPTGVPRSASTRRTCSASGTGSAVGTPTTRRSGCR